jgi:hypothetical protein
MRAEIPTSANAQNCRRLWVNACCKSRFMEWAHIGGKAGGKTRAPGGAGSIGPQAMAAFGQEKTPPSNQRRVRNYPTVVVSFRSGSRSLCSGAKDNRWSARQQAAEGQTSRSVRTAQRYDCMPEDVRTSAADRPEDNYQSVHRMARRSATQREGGKRRHSAGCSKTANGLIRRALARIRFLVA